MTARPAPLLEVRRLVKHFESPQSRLFEPKRFLKAVDGISFKVFRGDTFGIIGESGCGKTTLGRAILALETADSGEAFFEGVDILKLGSGKLRRLRRDVQVIFQDPFSSLNPRMTVEQILREPFIIHDMLADPVEREGRIAELIELVELSKEHRNRYPHMFSGGQRQRISIARALALNPKLIICDEPVSALDVSIQAQILNLLKDLQEKFGLTYVFIAHDFSVIRHLCNRVGVMYLGRIVEMGKTETLFEDPQHPYTEALLSAVPVPDPAARGARRRILLAGDIPSPLDPPPGCSFHPRCRYAVERCRSDDPALEETVEGRWSACPVRPFRDQPSRAALRRS